MINLPNGWFIGADQYQYKIGNATTTRKNPKTGAEETVYNYRKYPSSLAEAFRAIMAEEGRRAIAAEDMELDTAIKKLQAISDFWKAEFEKALKFEQKDFLDEEGGNE